MRILWHSNAPWAPTGYGNQSDLFIWRLKDAGHEVAASVFYGLQGGPMKIRDVPIFAAGRVDYGLDTLPADALYWQADIVITLMDTWPLPNSITDKFMWCPWLPVDHDPLPPPVREALRTAYQPIAYSKFGMKKLQEVGLRPLYVPHGVDTKVFWPVEREEARDKFQMDKDVFMVGIVAANNGWPSRKAFDEQIRAFAQFHKRHPDSLLYLHTSMTREGGENIWAALEAGGVSPKAVKVVDQYQYDRGFITSDGLAYVYSAMDVLLNATRGEGFGIPIVEAQACGTPVIVTDFSAMPELVPDDVGWKVPWNEDDKFFSQESYQVTPKASLIEEALEKAYNARGDSARRERARAWIKENYDANLVMEKHWIPALEQIEKRLEREKESKTTQFIPARDKVLT